MTVAQQPGWNVKQGSSYSVPTGRNVCLPSFAAVLSNTGAKKFRMSRLSSADLVLSTGAIVPILSCQAGQQTNHPCALAQKQTRDHLPHYTYGAKTSGGAFLTPCRKHWASGQMTLKEDTPRLLASTSESVPEA